MALIIRTISYKGLPPNQEITGQFDTQGGTIGRAPNNHLVLPDPEKYVSRLHASIVFEAGQYFIQDSSTGGTYLGNSDVPLHDARMQLHNGEKLRIGDYELQVSITDAAESDVTQVDQPVRQLDFAESSILGESSPSSKPSEPPADFFSSFVDQPESSSIHENFTPPNLAETPQASDADDLDFGDLLSKLDGLPGAASPSSPQTPDLPTLPDDFFADEPEADVSHVKEEQGPEELAPAKEEYVEDLAFPGMAETGPETPKEDAFAQSDPFAIQETPVFAQKEQKQAFSDVSSESVERVVPQPVPKPTEPPVAQPSSPGVAPVQPSPRGVASLPSDDSLLREFLAGAGIADPSFIPPEQYPVMMRTSGELLRSMVEGLMQVLRARAELKSQFRVSVTTMRSVNNNPLKFTPNVDDAMRLVLSPTNPGFLPPKQAVSEGFSDIMNHQIAMTAGIQAALADILRSFDPQLIEKTQGEGVLFQKKAKCWEYYVERYPHLKAVAQEEFFGDAFADAYEKQMLLLSRSNQKPS